MLVNWEGVTGFAESPDFLSQPLGYPLDRAWFCGLFVRTVYSYPCVIPRYERRSCFLGLGAPKMEKLCLVWPRDLIASNTKTKYRFIFSNILRQFEEQR